jgi:hypothetical protein
MIERAPRKKSSRSVLVVLAPVLALAALASGCGTSYFEIPIETPIQAKLDVSAFQRVLIAGFVAGGTDDVDANQETVRLLRSQLRSKSELRVIDSDVMELAEIARDQQKTAAAGDATAPEDQAPFREAGQNPPAPPSADRDLPLALPQQIKDEKDLEPYERLFANTAYWKRIGEEYQNPLIVTGTVLFMTHSRAGYVTRDVEDFDSFGRRRVVPVRTYMERKGFILRPKFVFIDGRTGATMHQEGYREEVLYPSQNNTPALSSYFELMDRLVPNFLSALSSQKIKGTRVLLK